MSRGRKQGVASPLLCVMDCHATLRFARNDAFGDYFLAFLTTNPLFVIFPLEHFIQQRFNL